MTSLTETRAKTGLRPAGRISAPRLNIVPGQRVRRDVERYYASVAPFIDAELEGRGDEAYWTSVGKQASGGSILELGAGTGRVTRLLSACGARVVGADLSSKMLEHARKRLAGNRSVSLLLADMRRLALRRTFQFVVAAGDPFCHLAADADRDAALRTASAHLETGGRLILDALWFSERQMAQAASPDGRGRERRLALDGRELRIVELWRCNPRSHRCTARYRYFVDGEAVSEASFKGRAWTPAELHRRFSEHGLEIESQWGDYSCHPWDQSSSPHLVVEAVKG